MPIPAPYIPPPQPPPQPGERDQSGQVVSWDSQVRGTGRGQQGIAAAWPRGGALSVVVENSMDQAATIELHGALVGEGAKESVRPLWVFQVGSGQRVMEGLRVPWAPWIFPMPFCPGGVPKSGKLSITFGVAK